MADDQILYRRMELSDRGAVLEFLRQKYPDNPRQSDPEFWNWHYLDHPKSRSEEIPVWLALSGGRIVGHTAAIPVDLNVGGHDVGAVWIVDLMVDDLFRRTGIATKLVLEANRGYKFLLANPSVRQHSAALFTGLGWRTISEIPRYHVLLHPGSAIPNGLLSRSIDALYMPFRHSERKLASLTAKVRPVPAFDGSFDELWQECRAQWSCSVIHSSEFLSWQFEKQPGKTFEIIGCFDGRKMLGYAVLFFRKPNESGVIHKAAISDICYHPSGSATAIDSLIAAALMRAIERRAGGLVTDVLDPLLQERLQHFGFWRLKSGLRLMAIGPDGNDVLYDPRSWHLTRADSDISIFEEPNL